ncbi:MAG: EamA family transporter [Gammaproteobacteria bacterium]|nr:EamA family transporter [Gammaproteobacteria bacterium]
MIVSRSWIYLILLSLIWGSSFWLIKQGLESLTPIQVALLRIIFAGICLLPFLFRSRTSKLPLKMLAIIGMVGNIIPALCFAFAQQIIPSALAGMTNSLQPILTMILAFQFFNLSIQKQQVIGVIIGFVGALLLTAPQDVTQLQLSEQGAAHYWATGLVILATFCYALSTNLIRNYCAHLAPVTIAATSINFYLLPAAVILFFNVNSSNLELTPQALGSIGSVFLLGSIGTAFALIVFNRLVHLAGAVTASLVTYLIPIVAIIIGLLDNEVIVWHQYVGILIIFIGLLMLSLSKSNQSHTKSG